ncbi:MAG: hypothetical protein E7773_14780 [Sphingomonas sp.]|uniref:hypothetical protein n=1 Tax=Sphingomonas sp. TaxID=28214 RepID=UPI0012145CF4|nr:hypothetical protein [Sphingomonas sp.]THD34451.1 MAG: hypothetical protein E7773_14780 [Sphingomonas sp.]
MPHILLDWRVSRGETVAGFSAVVEDVQSTLRIVEQFGRDAVNGEYRVTVGDHSTVYASAAGIRAWLAAGTDLPPAMRVSAWRSSIERAIEAEALVASLRSSLRSAARRGLVSDADADRILAAAIRASAEMKTSGD